MLLPFATVPVTLLPGMMLLTGAAGDDLLEAALDIVARAPPRRMMTPMGKPMSAALTNCGDLGWVSDQTGYRYEPFDPDTGLRWQEMPEVLAQFAKRIAGDAGFPDFAPDACLVNLYEPGTKMGLHQDRDERDFSQPIVSLSFGAAAVFRIGGLKRRDPAITVTLHHGDAVVFGGPARRVHHGIDRILPAQHDRLGSRRLNLTFRKAA